MAADALGSPVAHSNPAGTVTGRSSFAPYGEAYNAPIDGPGYTGHVMDAATGLTYMQQRYYDPGIGRFLSVDPVTADENTGDNFNRYWYANNNPYKFFDPDGRCTGSHISNEDGTCAGSGDFLSNGFGPTMTGAQTVVHQAAIESQLGFNSETAMAVQPGPGSFPYAEAFNVNPMGDMKAQTGGGCLEGSCLSKWPEFLMFEAPLHAAGFVAAPELIAGKYGLRLLGSPQFCANVALCMTITQGLTAMAKGDRANASHFFESQIADDLARGRAQRWVRELLTQKRLGDAAEYP